MNIGKKIIILGCPGSGKSTFARSLHDKTGLPLFHLDRIWWKADKTHISREEFDERLKKILQGKEWIIDGDYSRTYEVRIESCDTILFLDFDEDECMKGIRERAGKKRPDMPWSEDGTDPQLLKEVADYRKEKRPVLFSLFEKHPEKTIHIFKTRSEAYEWLSEPVV